MTNKSELRSPHFWTALTLICLGFLFLLDNLDIIDIGDIWQFWPLIFVAIGLMKLKSSDYRDRTSASFFIGFGLLFLFFSLDILDWSDVWQFWPVVLIAIGLSIIFRKTQRVSRAPESDVSQKRLDVVAIFGGSERKIVSDSFEGGNITAICGGAKLDFANAKLSQGENVIDVFALCGGAEIYVPEDWNVEIRGMPIFGGFEDARRKVPTEEPTNEKTLII